MAHRRLVRYQRTRRSRNRRARPTVVHNKGVGMCRSAVLVVGVLALVAALPAASQTYPSRPIRLIVPYTPGGTIDAYARALARQVEAQIGQPIVIDNRPGANGILGADTVAKAN